MLALALAGVGLLLTANLYVTNGWWRMALIVGAVCAGVGVVQLLPRSWHRRLSAVAITFVTVAGVVPLFVVEPGDSASPAPPASPKLDPAVQAAYVDRGPFDQRLPEPLRAEGLTSANVGSEAGPTKLTAVELKIGVDPKAGVLVPGDNGEELLQITAHLEIYPNGEDARKRAQANMEQLAVWNEPLEPKQDIGNYCFQGIPPADSIDSHWECGGARGNAFAATTVAPGSNADLGFARDTVGALLNYADSMARKATPLN